MAWKFVLRDLAATPLGELWNASERELALALNGLGTASFKIRNDAPLAETVLDGDALLSVYEGDELRFHGDLISAEEVVERNSQSIKVNAAGLLWRLSKRLVGKADAGVTYGDPSSQLDRGEIIRQALATANGEANTAIRAGTIGASSLTYVYDPPWRYKPLSEAITELSAALDGFDFSIDPVEPVYDSSGLHLGTLRIAASIGQDRPNVAFEYGDGKHNLAGWRRAVERGNLLNVGFNLPALGSSEPTVTASDAGSIAARGRMEGVVESNVIAQPLRQRLVDEHVRVRRYPRQTIGFTPAFPDYVYGTDFEVGDTVRVRAKVAGAMRVDAAVRVYGVTWRDGTRGDMELAEVSTVNEGLFA